MLSATAVALSATAAAAQTAPAAAGDPVGGSLAGAAALSSVAATSAGAGEILVTARRQTERAQDVPIALSVLSGRTLEHTGGYTLTDVQNQTPSLVAYQSNPRNSSVGIRGIGVTSASDGTDTSVGVYVDNIYLGRPGMALEDLIDVDRIEVLRGPQGTLFGRNTSAGVVNVTTKAPSFTFGGTVEGSYGNYGYNQERFTLTGPIIADKLAFRLTGFNTHRDGVLPNLTTGIAGNSVGRDGVRLQFLAKPTDKLTIRLIGEYSQENDTCCVSVYNKIPPAIIATATKNTLKAFKQLGFIPVAGGTYSLNNSPQNMLTDQDAFSAEVNWDLGWGNFTSISAYRYWHFDPLQDSDNTPLDIIQVNVAQTKDQQYSQEFRIASNPGKFSWQAGVYLFDQTLKDHYILNQFGSQAQQFYTIYNGFAGKPVPSPAITAGSQYNGDTSATTFSGAVFGQANYKVTNRLTLTAGLRYTYDDKHGITNTSNVGTPYSVTSLQFHYNVSAYASNVSYLLSAAYKLTDNSLIYASYSTGYKSPGLNLNAYVTPGTPVVLKPEEVADWEAGLKQSLFGHRLTLDVDGYWTTLTGLQANIVPTNGAKSYLANVGNILSRGVEAEADLRLHSGLDLSVNGSYNDAHYTSYTNGPCPLGGAAVCNLTGRPVYEAPEWIFNASAGYHFDLNDKVQPYVLVQYSYRSSAFGTVDDGPLTQIPAYSLVNARLGAAIEHGRYDVSFWVNNALNARYFQNLSTSSIPGAGTFATAGQLGTPRTFGATVRASF